MKIGIVGLGLIGGSLAKAIQAQGGHTVYGADADPAVLAAARATGAVAAPLTDDNLAECELLALALFPAAIVDWLQGHAAALPKSAVVCAEDGQTTVYISQISSQTLRKRAGGDFLPGNILPQ